MKKILLISILAISIQANEYVCKSMQKSYQNNMKKFQMVVSRDDYFKAKHYLNMMIDDLENVIIYCKQTEEEKQRNEAVYNEIVEMQKKYFGIK